ncbi:oxidoreductase [Pedobacter quisquiliarum]|uniref:Oxidoreductase n=1 Tax=Pedobacter quisquiliarum TaxID=1834438 RepID=A0A916U0J0_9SPHI|nr:Gfo/Idh/MocA family oxidoreductase [Pedobacter quisquiliarum]GGC54565.1 oxidoreductase [Pedobacter quisquiliarum]
MEKIINTGLLAYGMSGKLFHAPFLSVHPGFNLSAVTERNEQKAPKDYPGITSYNSIDELMDDPAIDLVVVNTPNYSHYDYTRQALLKGKHVLVEKPFAATAEEAQALFDLAREVGKQVFVYQNRRWDSDYLAVKQVIDSGVLGKLAEVHIRFDRYRNTIGPKTFKEELVPATGLQYDLGAHLLDQAINLFGKPLNFYKILGLNRQSTKVDDYFHFHLEYPDSLQVFVCSSMLVPDPQAAFVVHGEQGSLVKYRADIQEAQLLKNIRPGSEGYGVEPVELAATLTRMNPDGSKRQEQLVSETGSYMPLFDGVYQGIVNNVPYAVTEEQVLTQLQILEAPVGFHKF